MATSELPGNSHVQTTRVEKVTKVKKTEVPPKKVEKIVTTNAVQQKKSLTGRFVETFIRGHAKTAWTFIVHEVLVPSAKDMLANSVSQGVEQMVYGEVRGGYRRRDPRRDTDRGLVGHTSYNRISDDPRRVREEPRMVAHGRHDFDDIILATRVEADMVIERLFDLIDMYDQVTVADLYELVGVTGSFTDERWGWLDMRGADIQRTRGGDYRLILPRTVPLSK